MKITEAIERVRKATLLKTDDDFYIIDSAIMRLLDLAEAALDINESWPSGVRVLHKALEAFADAVENVK